MKFQSNKSFQIYHENSSFKLYASYMHNLTELNVLNNIYYIAEFLIHIRPKVVQNLGLN